MSLTGYSKEQLKELSLIEMAYEFLKNSKQPISFQDLVSELSSATGISEDEMRSRLAQFYTDINIDGRFFSLGENRWGLRQWYPVDTAEEEVVSSVKPKKKKAKKVVDEEDLLDDYDEIDEDEYDEIDDFEEEDDDLDEDEESFEDDLDEVEDFDDEEDVVEEDEDFDLGEDEEDLEEEEDFEDEEEDL